MSIRKALGAVKDKTTISIARVTGAGAVSPDLDVAIVRATSHDDAPPDERHAREVLRLASAPPPAAPACLVSASPAAAPASACVASIRRCLRFSDLLLPMQRFVADGRIAVSLADMETEKLLGRARHLRHLLDRLLACRPAGAAGASRVVRAALQPVLADTFRVYEGVTHVLALLLDRFFDGMDYPECVKAFETYVGTAKQIDALKAFYDWCDGAGVVHESDADFLDVRRVDDKLLGTMEQFVRQRSQAGRAEEDSPPRPLSARNSAVNARRDDVDDMTNGIKALPAPPTRSSARPCVERCA